ncbi:hypothetical protein OSB04_020271 [Centaurea solstitialis]|uniref:Retrotransposon protein, putative, Ty1-copia subclass n=1 Tax=Centaurea solstitialis TaxID=347529 RepID=A0AA38SZI4_9ASTR|nr:hypothetical protein OSB04_020271 [Centaurea solstitialis]
MKDLGEAAYILGIKIYRNRSKRLIGLSQSTYIDKIMKKFRMDESKKGFIPMQHGIVLSKTQCPVSSQDQDKMKSIPYASAIGSIMYAMLCTRPDVAYSVSVTSRYQQNPGEPHWVAVKNILKYLRKQKICSWSLEVLRMKLVSSDILTLVSRPTEMISDHSQGTFFTLNGGAISWKSSKQDTIADSTTEAEYIAASDAAKEAVWLRNFLSDLRVVASVSRPIDIFCDNSGAVAQAKKPREHHKSRHVLRKYHLIREIIGRGDVRICKIPTEDNVADPLTNPLARVKHEAHANSIGMQYLDTILLEEHSLVDHRWTKSQAIQVVVADSTTAVKQPSRTTAVGGGTGRRKQNHQAATTRWWPRHPHTLNRNHQYGGGGFFPSFSKLNGDGWISKPPPPLGGGYDSGDGCSPAAARSKRRLVAAKVRTPQPPETTDAAVDGGVHDGGGWRYSQRQEATISRSPSQTTSEVVAAISRPPSQTTSEVVEAISRPPSQTTSYGGGNGYSIAGRKC